ncbi:MAG: glycosyltransferase family 39 protein [Bacteroidetes bacterium]|nr:glycosyltransferase family 39 protein [Bacteroidota bacterium]
MFKFPLNRLAFILSLGLVLPFLIMKGMFMDGLMYAAVSKNLALGIGEFWQPFYGEDYFGLPGFYENPPLGIYNLALFFKLFGTAFWVERLFILVLYLLTMVGIWLNLKAVIGEAAKGVFWFCLLAWALIPTVFWSFRQNMMEIQMLPFLLFSNWVLIKTLKREIAFAQGILFFSLLTVAAFLVKGVVGAFLIGAPFAYFIAVERNLRAIYFGMASLLLLLINGFVFYQNPEVKEFFYYYLEIRTANRINHVPIVGNRFWIIGEFLQQMIIPLVLALIVYFSQRKVGSDFRTEKSKNWILFFILLGIGGSLPFMITKVQRPFYLMTSFPFYIIALSLFLEPKIRTISHRLSQNKPVLKALNVFSLVLGLLVISLSLVNWGDYRRDEQLQKDLASLKIDLDQTTKVYVSGALKSHWSLKAYAVRNVDIDLLHVEGFDPEQSKYVISKENLTKEHGQFKEFKNYDSFTVYILE